MKTLSGLGISPTPWKADGMYITSVHGIPIAGIGVPMCESNDFANHRLVLAAPDLYEALRKLLIVAKNRMPSQPTVDELEVMVEAEAALAKASGESEVAK